MKKLYLLSVIILLSSQAYSQVIHDAYDCSTIIVGRKASASGNVLIGHNEDDGGMQVVNFYKIDPCIHEGGKIKLKKGAEITQADTTFGYIWLEMPGQDFADSFLNDNGVLITSNSCPSREQSGDIVQGGIGYDLRKIVAERAKSARDAVTIAGKLLTDLGYNASGRTYTIADIKEAWMLSVVKGKHWVAMRIPDEHVVYLPNYYIIEEIDFNDKENYLCSPELEEYAIKMNWYDPSTGRFSFREAYGNERSAKSKGNIGRMWVGVNMLSAIEYDMNDSFPVSFVPEKPVTIEKLISILGNHYEGTSLDDSKNYTEHNPHKNKIMNICARHQQLSFVAELRDGQEIETGCRLWLAPRRGCVHAYMPVYYGTKDFPPGYKYYSDNKKVFEMHFQVPDDMYDKNNGKAWWTFYSVTDYIDQDYISRIEDRKNYKDLLQKELFEITAEFDKNIHEKWVKNSSIAADEITVFTGMILEMVLKRNMIYLENR